VLAIDVARACRRSLERPDPAGRVAAARRADRVIDLGIVTVAEVIDRIYAR
jgi:hypothetical protein